MEASQPEGESRGVVCNDDAKCRRFSDVSEFSPLGKPPLVSFAPTVTLTYWDAEEENTVPALLLDGREEENTVPALLLDGREEENTVPSMLLDGREEENTVPSLILDGREEENTLLLDGREEENTANEVQEEEMENNNGCPLFLDDKENTDEKTEENTTSVPLGKPETVQLLEETKTEKQESVVLLESKNTATAPSKEAQQEGVKGGSGDLPEAEGKDMKAASDGLLEAEEIERIQLEAKPLASGPTAKLATFTLTYEDEELSECCSQVNRSQLPFPFASLIKNPPTTL
jgi:hypothetical protein